MPSRNDAAGSTSPSDAPRWRGRLRAVGAVVGIALLALAAWTVVADRAQLSAAFAALRDPPPSLVALVLASVAASVLLTGLLFSILMRRFARVGFLEMQSLLAATALLNYLPLKPGFIGRIAWHRARHGVAVRDSLRTLVEAMLLSLAVIAAFLAALAATNALGLAPGLALALPAVAAAGLAFRATRTACEAFLVRQAELALWTLRYWAAFRLIGAPIELDAAIALGGASVLATLVPFVSNGLGIREWTIALLAPIVARHGGDSVTAAQGIVAELVLRAAEIAVILPTGLAGLAHLARLRARGTAANADT